MLRSTSCFAAALFALSMGCGDDTNPGGGGAGGGGGDEGGGGAAPSLDFDAGGDRPVRVRVPPDYDPEVAAPLVISLHGYGATGALEEVYLDLSVAAAERGVVFAAPDGTPDLMGRYFWNATDACCNFDDIEVDDSAYLIGLVDEISTELNIDPNRVYFAGHSNGGFMSHRMACDHADRVAAIAVLAGATFADPADCAATEPVSVLQIHGTADDTIVYEGGSLFEEAPYPSVDVTIENWLAIDGCDEGPDTKAPLDLDVSLDGEETTDSVWSLCQDGVEVELFAIQGGTHVPVFYELLIGSLMMDWLLAHPKP